LIHGTAETTIQFMDPRGKSLQSGVQPARRPASFEGGVIGLINNSKINSGQLLDRLADPLRKALNPANILLFSKTDATRPAPKYLIQQVSETCDAAVLAIGD